MERRDSTKRADEQHSTTDQSSISKPPRILWIGIIVLLVAASPIISPTFAQETQQSEEEPNGQQSKATKITVGDEAVQVNGVLGFRDEDWFAFDVPEGSSITIDYSGSAGEARLRGPDGTVLDAESPTIQRLQGTADETGTYYLQLTTVAAANGDYTFTIDLDIPTEDTESEQNDPSSTPNDTPTLNENSSSENGDKADYCSQKGIQPVSPGNYSDHLTPRDRDVLLINLSEGDFIAVNLTYEGAEETRLAIYGDADNISFTDSTGAPSENIPNLDYNNQRSAELYEENNRQSIRIISIPPGNTQFRVYAESDGICLGVHTMSGVEPDADDSEGGGAGAWSLAFAVNEPDARTIKSTVPPTNSKLAELESRIEELEQQIEELQQRIDELQNETDTGEED